MDEKLADRYLGRTIAKRFRINRLVGQGAFAWVFHGLDLEGAEVAIKLLHSREPTARMRFDREIEMLKSLPPNPNLVKYIDTCTTHDGFPALIIEYIDGITLQRGIDRRKTLPPQKAVRFMVELCLALTGLHQLGVAHRDVKPENILLPKKGGIKLIDLGLLRDAQGILKLLEQEDPFEKKTFSKELDRRILVGTPEYMAPEQFADAQEFNLTAVGRTNTWSDVFSLGVILYQLLSGKRLYPIKPVSESKHYDHMMRYMRWRISLDDSSIPPIPNIDKALDSLVRKALRHDYRRRQLDARALLEDCLRYLRTGRGVPKLDDARTLAVAQNRLVDLEGTIVDQDGTAVILVDDDDTGAVTVAVEREETPVPKSMPKERLTGHTGVFFAPQGRGPREKKDAPPMRARRFANVKTAPVIRGRKKSALTVPIQKGVERKPWPNIKIDTMDGQEPVVEEDATLLDREIEQKVRQRERSVESSPVESSPVESSPEPDIPPVIDEADTLLDGDFVFSEEILNKQDADENAGEEKPRKQSRTTRRHNTK